MRSEGILGSTNFAARVKGAHVSFWHHVFRLHVLIHRPLCVTQVSTVQTMELAILISLNLGPNLVITWQMKLFHYCSQVYCRCFLYRCIRRAFLLAQNVEQWGQWSPGMLRCIASMWDTRLSFLLYSWPHSVHFQKDSPFMSVSWYIIPAITSKRDKNLFQDNFLSWWYLDTWV